MMAHRAPRSLSLAFFLTSIACFAGMQAVGGAQASQNNAVEENVLAQAAAEYDFALGENRSAKLTRIAKPILTWTNPLRTTPEGSVFLWTYHGIPQAVACIYTYGEANENIDHEFQSLARWPLVVRRKERVVWEPPVAGLEPKEVPDAPAPAENEAKRLSQMRAIARAFSATVGGSEGQHELRLLPQPVYRYPNTDKSFVDGSIFAFVQATDPEVLLLIEASPTADSVRWQYAFARMSDRVLEVKHGDRVVWTAEHWNWEKRDPKSSYIKFTEKVKR